MTYSKYLHVKELLSLQNPLTPADQQDLHDSEQLFIVVHQASETLLSLALTDLRHIEANQCGRRCFAYRAERATQVVEVLEGNLSLLHHTLKPEDFLQFRDRFGTASGLQSAQFHELFRLTERLTAGDRGDLVTVELRLVRLQAAVRRWRATHLKMVRHMIGSLPGSGDTSGVRYLERRLNGSAHAELNCSAHSEVDDGATVVGPRTSS